MRSKKRTARKPDLLGGHGSYGWMGIPLHAPLSRGFSARKYFYQFDTLVVCTHYDMTVHINIKPNPLGCPIVFTTSYPVWMLTIGASINILMWRPWRGTIFTELNLKPKDRREVR